jgi:hypothetical protein
MTAEFITLEEAPKDRWGRYLITRPDGKATGYTRVTTIAKALDDEASLTAWKGRMTATGLVKRPDLLASASTNLDDRRNLDGIVKQAIEAAGASTKANIGTALHALTHQIDMGRQPAILPGLQADIDAYQATIKQYGINFLHMEALLISDTFEYAGTTDRIITIGNQQPMILDLKTWSIDYAIQSIAVQLALYANAEHLYDWRTDERTAMPNVSKTQAMICHLPAGTGQCSLHLVDIEAGWNAAQLALQVRAWRKRKDLATPYQPAYNGKTVDRTELLDRIRQLPEEGQTKLKQFWPHPGVKLPDMTAQQIVAVSELVTTLEAEHAIPFPEVKVTKGRKKVAK